MRGEGREFTEFITIPLMPCIFIVSDVSAAAAAAAASRRRDSSVTHADVHLLGLSREVHTMNK